MSKSNKLKGKITKNSRKITKQKDNDLNHLFNIFYEIKVSEGRAPNTLRQYVDNFNYFIKFLEIANVEPKSSEISKELLRSYIKYMRKDIKRFDGHKYKNEQQTKGLSITTCNTRMKTLRVLFKCLHEEGYISNDPTIGVKNLREEKEEITVLTIDELRALLQAPSELSYPEFRDLCLMYYSIDTMMRPNEAINTKIDNIDFKGKYVTIPASVAKNRKARTLPLQDKTVKLLQELIAENKVDFDSPYVFLTNYGEPITRDHYRKRLNIYVKRAGIKKDVSPYTLRHTAATLFLESSPNSLRHLALILGHSDLRMVQRYTHLSEKSLLHHHDEHSVINQLSEKLNKGRKTRRKTI